MKIEPKYRVLGIYTDKIDPSVGIVRVLSRVVFLHETGSEFYDLADQSSVATLANDVIENLELEVSHDIVEINDINYLIVDHYFWIGSVVIMKWSLYAYYVKYHLKLSKFFLFKIGAILGPRGWIKDESDGVDVNTVMDKPWYWYIKPFGRRIW